MTKTFITVSFHFEITEVQPTSGADLVIDGCPSLLEIQSTKPSFKGRTKTRKMKNSERKMAG